MMNIARCAATVLATFLIAVATVSAAPIAITSYDIEQTPGPGWGGWSHSYAGTISNTGRTISGNSSTPEGNQIFNYSGGSGTLNDQQVSSDIAATHLFTTRNADDAQPITPVITLRLGGTFFVSKISFWGGDIGGNLVPGALNGVTVEIGGTSVTLQTTPFGALNAIGVPFNDLIDLTATPLAKIPTEEIVLRNFTASFFGFPLDQFSITEIVVDGVAASTPVAIDIKPGGVPNTINPRNKGKVPVAILSSASFNAPREVDSTSLTFGRTGNEQSLSHCGGSEDVNRDGRPDLVCHFNIQATAFVAGDIQGVLKGRTLAGIPIQGADSVQIIQGP